MHEIQRKLLRLIQEDNLGRYTLRQIGEMIQESSPQKVKHHLQQLEKRGLIKVDKISRVIEKVGSGMEGPLTNAQLLSLPIFGSANAGAALHFAEQEIEGYLKISSTFLAAKAKRNLFALRVDGISMNRAEVEGKRIENGDYVIVDADARTPIDGQIVLSVIDGMANIKRFRMDAMNQQVLLLSESSGDFPPIYIHESDNFNINGTVILVVKKPSIV